MCVTKLWWSNKRLGGSVLILKNNKRSVIWQRLLTWGCADNSNKTANNAKYSNCKGLNHETYDISLLNLQPLRFWFFFSTSNFISIHSPSVYKLSMIRLVQKVYFDVDF